MDSVSVQLEDASSRIKDQRAALEDAAKQLNSQIQVGLVGHTNFTFKHFSFASLFCTSC